MKKAAVVFALLAMAAFVHAAIVPIGQFTGQKQEGFETHAGGQFLPELDVFGGTGDKVLQLGSGQGLHVTTGWSFFSVTYPHGGAKFMGGAGVNANWVFVTPAKRFGGFFNTNADAPDATAKFYDASENLLATLDVKAPTGGAWEWNGWEDTTNVGIKRVEIIAKNRFNGFIMHDDMEYTAIPEPASLALIGMALLVLRRR